MAKIIIIAVAVLIVAVCNIIVAVQYNPKQMKKKFIDGQCVVGKIAAAIFYAPAWILKGLKWFITSTVA